jgi:hypothetical protein
LDEDGTIISYQWTKYLGPTNYTIVNPSASQTPVNNLEYGVYGFELRVTDNAGAIARDTILVVVNAAPNPPPVTNAGLNKTITLPTNSVTLAGSATDLNGTVISYLWSKLTGPASFNIVSPTSAQTVVNNLVQGRQRYSIGYCKSCAQSGANIQRRRKSNNYVAN